MEDTSMEDINFGRVFYALNYLNPEAIIKLHPASYSGLTNAIMSSITGNKLRLPEGFYYNEKNGVTNKHNTKSGMYITIPVLPLDLNMEMQQRFQEIGKGFDSLSQEQNSMQDDDDMKTEDFVPADRVM